MRVLGFLFLLISSVGFSQSESVIVCSTPGVRKLNQTADRLSIAPKKLDLKDLDSTTQDSVKQASMRNKEIILDPTGKQETKEIFEFKQK